jgi:hypothetical protein
MYKEPNFSLTSKYWKGSMNLCIASGGHGIMRFDNHCVNEK